VVEDGIVANYYFDKKYLLTVLEKDSEVRAYTILALDESFHPTIFVDNENEYSLGKFAFSAAPGIERSYFVDWTKTLGLYIEENDLGLESLGQTAFIGWLTYGAGSANSGAIGDLYKAEILDKEILKKSARESLRRSTTPNFYGWGNITLDVLEKTILTTSQFGNYSAAYK
jgi:hypothetical protein